MKRFKLNYFIIILIAILLTWALWTTVPWRNANQDSLAVIKARGELRISTLDAPLSYYSVNNQPAGFDYDLAQRFADYLGVKLKVRVRSNLNQLFDDLDNDNADLLAANLIYNTERLNRFTVGPPYYSVSQQLVYRLGQPRPKNLRDLRGRLAVSSGSAQISQLRQLKKKQFPQLSWEVSLDLSSRSLLEKVAEGKLDYTLADSATVGLLQRVHPQLAVAFDVTEEEPVTWYLRRNNSERLSAELLDFFSQLNDNGIMARLEEKYLGYVSGFDYVDTKTFLNAIDAVLPTLQPLFERYARDIDWKLLAAISYQESHWDP
ncbi:murein transglycosylase, partial [Sodalis-like endosymbiont of Proechinophthirus fluctus]|uniref:membrane-bound lytic murein transglycosylase MltF n=1 Tax=Sodalis-like endosymbiont of Proechinophthirus fluctus TaxID=1462730 RepID=UPI0007A8CA91